MEASLDCMRPVSKKKVQKKKAFCMFVIVVVLHSFKLHLSVYLMGEYAPQSTGGGQRTVCGNLFSSSTLWVPGSHSDLAWQHLTPEPSLQPRASWFWLRFSSSAFLSFSWCVWRQGARIHMSMRTWVHSGCSLGYRGGCWVWLALSVTVWCVPRTVSY